MATGTHKYCTVPLNTTTEALYKVIVIGDLGVGKTSITKRSAHGFFTPQYRATIGVDFSLKVYNNWEKTNLNVRLQLWDLAGQERFGNMTRVYYKKAVGAFVVFDVTRLHTFEAVQIWKTDLDSKILSRDGKPIPTVLLANKCDRNHDFNLDQLDEFCQKHKFVAWFKCSAKGNIGIDKAVHTLATEIIANDSMLEDSKSDGLDSAVPAAMTAQGAADEASALLRKTTSPVPETGGDELEKYKQLVTREKEEKKAVITKLENLVADLNLCRDVITQLQGKCEYYQSLSEQFQQQLQHTVQLYQQSRSEVIQCTQEKLTIEKQLERAQRVHHHLNRRLVTVEGQAIKERPSSQPVDQSMLEPYSITPTHRIKPDKKIGQGCYAESTV